MKLYKLTYFSGEIEIVVANTIFEALQTVMNIIDYKWSDFYDKDNDIIELTEKEVLENSFLKQSLNYAKEPNIILCNYVL